MYLYYWDGIMFTRLYFYYWDGIMSMGLMVSPPERVSAVQVQSEART